MTRETFEREVLQRLTAIETRLDGEHFDSNQCARHSEKLRVANHRITNIERQQGKQNLIAAALGTVGASVVLMGKYLFTRGG